MDVEKIDLWFPPQQQQQIISRLIQRVGLTRTRAECFVRLWIYLLVKQQKCANLKPPLLQLVIPNEAIVCTHREAAELFYNDKEQGSDRSAGMILDKLAALGLIKKHFDGNTTRIEIYPIPEILENDISEELVELKLDNFDPYCDAIPVANLLATNYNWMNRNTEAVPHRISRLLRKWASQYSTGMRVLRRSDNLNPVGFYLLYPIAKESEANFFNSPGKGLHLSAITEDDPFIMATSGDTECVAIFIRSWMIEPIYLESYRIPFVKDVQQTLIKMRQDFPNLCDLHTLIIHPNYEKLASALGFQKTIRDTHLSVYWMYLACNRLLSLDVEEILSKMFSR